MVKLATIREGAFRDDETARAEILGVAAPSYEDARDVVVRELGRCDTLYTARDEQDRLLCFYLTAAHSIRLVDGTAVPALYLGLSAAHSDAVTGIIAALYQEAINDAMRWEKQQGQRLQLWATTATPQPYLGALRYLSDTAPRLDGSYSEPAARLARAISEQFSLPAAAAHPFVLKRIAKNTRYSAAERQRIERTCASQDFKLFEQLGIDETEGDRLLFLAKTPSPHHHQ